MENNQIENKENKESKELSIKKRNGTKMKINPLPSLEYLNECFEIDSTTETGLRWKMRPESHGANIDRINRRNFNTQAGTFHRASGYYQVTINGIAYRSHRVLYSLYYKINIDEDLVDHKDGDSKNNSIENLRRVTHQQNRWNAGRSKNNTSGHKGIKIRNRKNGGLSYCVRVMVDGVNFNLGTFRDYEWAKQVYRDFIDEKLGQYATERT
jgi:hypothetical protein